MPMFFMATMPQIHRPAMTSSPLAAGADWLIGGNGQDTLIGGAGIDYYYGGCRHRDYFYLNSDIAANELDYILDFAAGTDYVTLPYIATGSVTFGVSGIYAYGYIPTSTSTAYIFLAQGATATQLQGGDALHLTVRQYWHQSERPSGNGAVLFLTD